MFQSSRLCLGACLVIGLAKAQPSRRCGGECRNRNPYAPDGPLRIVGRATLVAHLRDTLARFTVERAATRYVYHCEPRGAVIVEFDLAGRRLRSGKEYKQQCAAIIETSGGRITR